MSIIVLKKIPKILATLSFFLCIALLVMSAVSAGTVPQSFHLSSREDISFSSPFPMVATLKNSSNSSPSATVKLFGCIPISTANVQLQSPPELVVGGNPFGVKILAKGVLVVGIAKVDTPKGTCCPGADAGLQLGDLILAVNNTPVSTNSQLQSFVAQGSGQPLTLSIQREGQGKTLTLHPVLSSEGIYRIGIWVRDSTAGLGTLTFYDPQTGMYAGLGHGVCDSDTGDLMPLSTGEIVQAHINGIRKGTAGNAGELKGTLISNASLGTIASNCECGVFGTMTTPLKGETFPLGYKQEVEEGDAFLYSAVSGTVTAYTCQVEKINVSDRTCQNMIVKITDPALLAQTGGIVQGMSGSPIVQQGKLIGAVTHVFVNDPTRGYAVFAETMWQTANALCETSLPKAS